jgi:hypothetical protein
MAPRVPSGAGSEGGVDRSGEPHLVNEAARSDGLEPGRGGVPEGLGEDAVAPTDARKDEVFF